MALFDTTADALAVDAVEVDDHPTVQAWMNGGRAAGLILLSLALGIVAESLGYQWTFLVIAAATLVPIWLVTRIREPQVRTPAHSFDRRAFKLILRRRYVWFSVVLILAWLFYESIEGLVTFYMATELGTGPTTLGLFASLKGVGILIGGLLLAKLVKSGGQRRAAVITLVLVAAGGIAFSLLETQMAFLVAAPFWGVAVGFQWTNYVTIAMGVTDLRIAGSMFAILQTMSNIGLGAGEGLSTALTDNVGFAPIFLVAGLSSLLLIPFVLRTLQLFSEAANDDVDAVVTGFG